MQLVPIIVESYYFMLEHSGMRSRNSVHGSLDWYDKVNKFLLGEPWDRLIPGRLHSYTITTLIGTVLNKVP